MNRRHLLLLATLPELSTKSFAGAWASGSFDNDDALDWVSQCVGSKGTGFILMTLHAALAEGYLEAPQCSVAVAAAELVAASRNKASQSLPKELSVWLKGQQPTEIAKLAPVALKAVERVLNGPQSELRELWQENRKEFPNWRSHLTNLIERLK